MEKFNWFKMAKEHKREAYFLRDCVSNIRSGKAHYNEEFGLKNPVKFSNLNLNKSKNK